MYVPGARSRMTRWTSRAWETERDPLIGPITAEFRRPTRCDVAAGSGPVACKAVVPLPAEQMPTVPRMTGAGGVMP
jgi:hypothetical protein